MSAIPSMPLFCGDYLKDTTDLTLEEHGAYLMILMITWATGGKPLPDDDARMAKRLSIAKDRWVNKLKPVLAQFFDLSGGTWRNVRLEKEWAYVQEKISARREAGMKGGRPRKDGPGNGPNSSASNREDFPQTPDANPLKENETPKPNGYGLHKQTESTPPPSSAYAEERKEESVCNVGVNPREARTQVPPVSSVSTNVVPFVPPGGRQPLPAEWVPSDKQMALARSLGLKAPEMTVLKFRDYWRRKGTARDEEGWCDAWEWWVRKDVRDQGDSGMSSGGRDLMAAFNDPNFDYGMRR
jgi:uncharacterized protein YdaU (DUF1376 family)